MATIVCLFTFLVGLTVSHAYEDPPPAPCTNMGVPEGSQLLLKETIEKSDLMYMTLDCNNTFSSEEPWPRKWYWAIKDQQGGYYPLLEMPYGYVMLSLYTLKYYETPTKLPVTFEPPGCFVDIKDSAMEKLIAFKLYKIATQVKKYHREHDLRESHICHPMLRNVSGWYYWYTHHVGSMYTDDYVYHRCCYTPLPFTEQGFKCEKTNYSWSVTLTYIMEVLKYAVFIYSPLLMLYLMKDECEYIIGQEPQPDILFSNPVGLWYLLRHHSCLHCAVRKTMLLRIQLILVLVLLCSIQTFRVAMYYCKYYASLYHDMQYYLPAGFVAVPFFAIDFVKSFWSFGYCLGGPIVMCVVFIIAYLIFVAVITTDCCTGCIKTSVQFEQLANETGQNSDPQMEQDTGDTNGRTTHEENNGNTSFSVHYVKQTEDDSVHIDRIVDPLLNGETSGAENNDKTSAQGNIQHENQTENNVVGTGGTMGGIAESENAILNTRRQTSMLNLSYKDLELFGSVTLSGLSLSAGFLFNLLVGRLNMLWNIKFWKHCMSAWFSLVKTGKNWCIDGERCGQFKYVLLIFAILLCPIIAIATIIINLLLILWYGTPMFYLFFLGCKTAWRKVVTNTHSSTYRKVVQWIVGVLMCVLFFYGFIVFCILFTTTVHFFLQIIGFTFVGLMLYPWESSGKVLIAVITIAYLLRVYHDFRGNYEELYHMVFETCLEWQGQGVKTLKLENDTVVLKVNYTKPAIDTIINGQHVHLIPCHQTLYVQHTSNNTQAKSVHADETTQDRNAEGSSSSANKVAKPADELRKNTKYGPGSSVTTTIDLERRDEQHPLKQPETQPPDSTNQFTYVHYCGHRPGIHRDLFEAVVDKHKPYHVSVFHAVVKIILISLYVLISISFVLAFNMSANEMESRSVLELFAVMFTSLLPEYVLSSYRHKEHGKEEQLKRKVCRLVRDYRSRLEQNIEHAGEYEIIPGSNY